MPSATALPACSVLLLAGGRGQRVGGADKGLLDWHGQPLIAHLHATVRPLTDDLLISCNRNAARYAPYADRLVHDACDDFAGPLAGIRAGLAAAKHDWLLVLPCDGPRVDVALIAALRHAAQTQPQQAVMVRQGEYWQPLFSLWPRSVAPALEQAWQAGERSPQRVLVAQGVTPLDCPPDDPRLANLNTLALLADEGSADRVADRQ
ncbi:molybdenum cofactor guanylyltransferase MobA [Pseudomonas sp. UL073]|uniref:Molybdenum cofactor guanylyltransferase n=1 Tax=Zestomonas insulae TaxID=2809017 RepID=A0ABS2ICV6_9GAMM|nr:molybdenum cofactor guanylyltransferase MobA [Pseudomonas insulae]MBM7060941.1 molybdenum cofactor guanylyltransferase MobA [Pseudomonas insulae]